MTEWSVSLRWAPPRPEVYRFKRSTHFDFDDAMISNRKSSARRRYPHASAGSALESVLTVALSSVAAL